MQFGKAYYELSFCVHSKEAVVPLCLRKRGFERFTRFYTDASGCDIELIYQDCWVKFCDYNITNDELNALVEETQKFIDSLLPIWEANKKLGIPDANNNWTLTPNNTFNVMKG